MNLIKDLVKRFYFLINFFPFNNSYKMRGAKIFNKGKVLIKCKFVCEGIGNKIIFKGIGIIRKSLFYIKGNNNVIIIDDGGSIVNAQFYIEDNDNKISIGKSTNLCSSIHLACIEGTSIIIGDDCLFSSEIIFRTGDSHSLLDLNGARINPSSDIIIGSHVWIGQRVTITKGVQIGSNSMIGTGAIVTKSFNEENVVIVGVPARIIKYNINWCEKRI